jgi:hypothetical protein
MAKGDTNDVVNRLRATLPPWFPDLSNAPVLTALLTATADAFASVYNLYGFAKMQTRILTSTGGWLDMTAWDYFGPRFLRRSGESDDLFKPRILQEILRPRQTRDAITRVLTDLTGTPPVIVEAFNPSDCGGYGIPGSGYGLAGCYGSLALPNQIFVTAVRPAVPGIPNVGGYGLGPSGYGVAGEYTDASQMTGPIDDAAIYKAVADTVAAGIIGWVAIVNKLPSPPNTHEDTMDGALPTFDSGIVTMDHW